MSIKSIKEKQLLINLAKSFGQEADPTLIAEVEEHRKFESGIRNSIRSNVLEDLNKALLELKQQADRVSAENNYPLPPSLDDLENILGEKDDLDKKETEKIFTEQKTDTNITDLVSQVISKSVKVESFQQPEPLLIDTDLTVIQKKIKFLEQWIAKVSMAGPGGGETKLRFLDDVDRTAIQEKYYLRFNDTTNKFTFDKGLYYIHHGSFFSNVTQHANVSNQVYSISFNNTSISNQVYLINSSNIVCNVAGVYNFQFSLQLDSTTGGDHLVYIWPRINGVNVPNSATKIKLKQLGTATVAAWNFFLNMQANDKFELVWSQDTGGL